MVVLLICALPSTLALSSLSLKRGSNNLSADCQDGGMG